MSNYNLGVVPQECGGTARSNEHTREGYSYGNVLKFCTFMQNLEIDAY